MFIHYSCCCSCFCCRCCCCRLCCSSSSPLFAAELGSSCGSSVSVWRTTRPQRVWCSCRALLCAAVPPQRRLSARDCVVCVSEPFYFLLLPLLLIRYGPPIGSVWVASTPVPDKQPISWVPLRSVAPPTLSAAQLSVGKSKHWVPWNLIYKHLIRSTRERTTVVLAFPLLFHLRPPWYLFLLFLHLPGPLSSLSLLC